MVEAADQLAGEDGFIDKAFEVDEADLSEEHGLALLKRFVYELTIVYPLEELYSECRLFDHQLPKNLSEVLEKLVERSRSLEGIEAKAVKTMGEEWKEHEKRLKQF